MKKIFLLSLLTISGLSALFAQNGDSKVMSQEIFAAYLEEMQMIKTPAGRFDMAMKIAEKEHFYTGQIQEMAFMLDNDKLRFQFALKAFENAVNPEHYYTVLDAFDQTSTAFRFADLVKHTHKPSLKPGTMHEKPEQTEIPQVAQKIKYPDAEDYDGVTPPDCEEYLDEKAFSLLYNDVRQVKSPQSKLKLAKNSLEEECLSCAQIMKIAGLLQDEKLRCSLFEAAYDKIYDRKNFLAVLQMTEDESCQKKLTDLTQPVLKPDEIEKKPIKENCKVPAREMDEIIAVLRDEGFESGRIEEAKSIIKTKKCFRTEQVIRILKTLSYENTRLELAKFAFPYTIDKANYYKVNEIFEFSSSKEQLREFMENQ